MPKSKKSFGTNLRAGIEILNIIGFSALFVAIARLLPALASAEITPSTILETALGFALGSGAIYTAVKLKKKLHIRMEMQHTPLEVIREEKGDDKTL